MTGCDRDSGNLRYSETLRLADSDCNTEFIIIALYFYIIRVERELNRMYSMCAHCEEVFYGRVSKSMILCLLYGQYSLLVPSLLDGY